MFFWNSLAFSMIQQISAIWCLVPKNLSMEAKIHCPHNNFCILKWNFYTTACRFAAQCLQIHHSRIEFCFVLYIEKADSATVLLPLCHTHTHTHTHKHKHTCEPLHSHLVLSSKVNVKVLPLVAQRIFSICDCFVFWMLQR